MMLRSCLKKTSLVLVAALLPLLAHAQVEAMDEQEMGDVSGGEGIALQLGLYFNMTPDTSNILAPNNDAAPFNASCPAMGAAAVTGNPCLFGLKFANRSDWLVFKDWYLGARIFQLNLDGDVISAGSAQTTWFNTPKFQNVAGTCMLPGATCTAANLGALNAIVLSYPVHALSYSSVTGLSSGYDSLQMKLNLGRLVVENGAMGDTSTKSYLGARIADNNGAVAQNFNGFAGMAIRGKAFFYGF